MSRATSEKQVGSTVGLFAGIGGIELGLHKAGFSSEMLCEIMPEAQRVLRSQTAFSGSRFEEDVRALADIRSSREFNRRFPRTDILAAGFPCQDLSQAGRTAGITGANSGLASCLLDMVGRRSDSPRWVIIENVPFMLQLDRGKAMSYLTERLEDMGFRWAYRIIDTRSFGIPQRRQRVILLASRTEDPRPVLFADNQPAVDRQRDENTLCGFYWTEGLRGLGWAIDAVPTLKGGSTVGIPSPPAIWDPSKDLISTPDIRDAERLQGFPTNWTLSAIDDPTSRQGPRWKLVGNAVTVNLGTWLGKRIQFPGSFDPKLAHFGWPGKWPRAAYGEPGAKIWSIDVSDFPVRQRYQPLRSFLRFPQQSLSPRATRGFLSRFERGSLREPSGFVASIRRYFDRINDEINAKSRSGDPEVALPSK